MELRNRQTPNKDKDAKAAEPEIVKEITTQTHQLVFFKLVIFSILVLVVPLSVFYITVSKGLDSTFAGILAAVSANIVLIGYIIIAFLEE